MIPQSPGEIAFSLGSIQVAWYGIFLATAGIMGLLIAQQVAKQAKLSVEKVTDIIFWAILMGFIGARLWHVWNEWWYYGSHVFDVWRIWEGGLALHGGLLFAALTVWYASRQHHLSMLVVVDIMVVGLSLAQVIGRMGNYFNEELFGLATNLPWGVVISETARPAAFSASASFHPLFLYEMLLNLFVFFALWHLAKRKGVGLGWTTALWCVGYGVIRFSLDFLRIEQYGFWGLSIAQWVSVGLVGVGLFLFWRILKQNRQKPQTATGV